MKRTVPEQLAAARVQETGRADEHRRVRVVTARVHAAVDLAGEVEPGVLGHRQRVHVAAQQHDRARRRPRDRRPPTRPRARVHVEPEAVDRVEHGRLGPGQHQTRARDGDGCAGGARPTRGASRRASARRSVDPFVVTRAEPTNRSALEKPRPSALEKPRPQRLRELVLVCAVRTPQRVTRPAASATSSAGSSGSERMCASDAAPATNPSATAASGVVGQRSRDAHASRAASAVARRAQAPLRTAPPQARRDRRRGSPTTTSTARRRRFHESAGADAAGGCRAGSTLLRAAGRSAAAASRRAAPLRSAAERGPDATTATRHVAVPLPRARGRGSSPARRAGPARDPRARRRRRCVRSSPRSTMRLSATRVVPSRDPEQAAPLHAAGPARIRGGRHARATGWRSATGRQRPVQQSSASTARTLCYVLASSVGRV